MTQLETLQHGGHFARLWETLCFQEIVPNMDMDDPVLASGERQGLEGSFAGSVQCIMGL